jgi:hypothetical protein
VSEQGHLTDPAAQEALRQSEKGRQARLLFAWEQLLKAAWGRELAYHLIYERGRALAASFEPAIKDGMCAALHMARNEGIREYGAALGVDLQEEFPDLWLTLQAEAIAARQAERAARRQVLERSAQTQHDRE